jgi:hypothetical protein
MTSETEQDACSICGEPYSGDGNEAEPVSEGFCCDGCNDRHVIPARLDEMRAAEREAKPPRQRWWMR